MAERSDAGDVAAMDARIVSVGDWRGETLARMRALIREDLPDVVETMKWKKPSNPAGAPVWDAMLADPQGVFNAGLNGNAMRAIDLAEGDTVDPAAFKALVQAAAADQATKRRGS